MSNIKEDLNALNTALEENKDSPILPGLLKTTDLSTISAAYLTDASKLALSKKSLSQIVIEDGEPYQTIYLSKVVKKDDLNLGVIQIADVINRLSEKGLIHSALASIGHIDLINIPKLHLPAAVYCFPLVPLKRMDEVNSLIGDFKTEDGFMSNPDPSLEKELPEGQFYADLNITVMPFHDGKEDILQKRINEYLRFLPEGTYLVSAKEFPVTGLSIPHEVIFCNPLLPSIKQVSLDHVHHIERVRGEIKEMNLVLGINYTTRDGTILGF